MKLLLDTHAFIWWTLIPARLSPQALTSVQDPQHSLLLSLVSPWEMQIKAQLGKLHFPQPLPQIVADQQ